MSRAKKTDNKLTRTFVLRLARELVSDCDTGFFLADNPRELKEALTRSADSLPPGALRSALQLVLEQDNQRESLIAALQVELRALSVKLGLHGDVLLTSALSQRLFQTLLGWIDVEKEFLLPDALEKDLLTHDEIHLLVSREPAIHILWALAAIKSRDEGSAHGNEASSLLYCLKPWLMDRNKHVAMATMAPLVPIILESLHKVGNDIGKLKTFRLLVKEFMAFTVAVNYKEHFKKGLGKSEAKENLSFQALLDGFLIILKALKLQGNFAQTETQSVPEQLNQMFPLASEFAKSSLKPPNVRVSRLADIAKVEFLVLFMIVEVLYWNRKSEGEDKMLKVDIGFLSELLGKITICNLTLGQTDMILDILLSDLSSINTLLDDKEKSLVCVELFKVLLHRQAFLEKNNLENLPRSKKAIEGFVKTISVARKYGSAKRTNHEILEAVACHVTVPPYVLGYLKSCKCCKSIRKVMNNRAVLGWLIESNDTQFQAVIEGIMNPEMQADEGVCLRRVDVKNSQDSSLRQKVHDQTDKDDLFFLDTTGEEKAQETSSVARQGKNSNKRKVHQVSFHKRDCVTMAKNNASLNDSSSASDSEGSQIDTIETEKSVCERDSSSVDSE